MLHFFQFHGTVDANAAVIRAKAEHWTPVSASSLILTDFEACRSSVLLQKWNLLQKKRPLLPTALLKGLANLSVCSMC